MNPRPSLVSRPASSALLAGALCAGTLWAAEVTFFSYSDIHFGANNGGKSPPKTNSAMVEIINTLPGTAYPDSLGGVVGTPRAIIMQGDLINDGAVADLYPTQWANYAADFGVNGEGRCKFPVFEGLGNHDANENLYVFNKIKERNLKRKSLNYIGNISSNGFHYSWDWDGVHFINLNLFGGNVWEGEADAYGRGHNPQFARQFLEEDLRSQVGSSGRPVVIVQHFRPVDENWWTYSAADKLQRVLQDYNVIAIVVGHQGGGVNNTWRALNWISSNGELVVCRITSNQFTAISRSATAWGAPFQKKIFFSYAESGLPAVVNNADWASNVTASAAMLSGKLLYEAQSPTEVTVHWGPTDAGTKADAWPHASTFDARKPGETAWVRIEGLQPWTSYVYRCSARNAKGETWAATAVPFYTPGLLPAGWETAMVGYEQRPGGGAHFADNTFTVRGSGRDIGERGERSDSFQFAYCRFEGDGEFKARIATAEARSREPKIGIMLRESLADNARHVSVLLRPKVDVRLVSRKAKAGASSLTTRPELKTAPCWVKLVRHANTFTGFVSEDGTTWAAVGDPLTLALPSGLYAGLAVAAGNRDESKLNTSTFDSVTVTSGKSPELEKR